MRSLALAAMLALAPLPAAADTPPLTVAPNGRYLQAGGKPFFWLGDTGWLMLSKLTREETERYLAMRARQGFTVIQVMVLHQPAMKTVGGVPALVDGDPARPFTTPGADPVKGDEYDFWDHLDWAVDRAAAHGLYLALVPSWGSLADAGKLTPESAAAYGRFLGRRYAGKPNIVWLNGGDTRADKNTATWVALAGAIKAADPGHLMTFHPFGRTDSSWTFHTAPWLDFNMFQSGHQTYAQDTAPGARGEDNWRFVAEDWARTPTKPTVDGEPSYEGIPHGLHDVNAPRWTAADVRRYAWWSVFAGAFGHTYGSNSVMQFYAPGRDKPAYGAGEPWPRAVEAAGAGQMRHLKALMLSRPYFERLPDQTLIADDGERYDRVLATRGKAYAMAYTWTGRPFTARLGAISGARVRASWFDPRTGTTRLIGVYPNRGERRFAPPGAPAPGNDWALVLDGIP